jgi:hypothetical protein
VDITAEHEADEAKHRHDIDDAYRAIGRYFVQFSRLVAGMRAVIGHRFTGETDDRIELAELAFAGAMAQQVSDSLFAMCRYDGGLSETEKAICDLLQTRVNEQIEWRNRFAHGDWWISPHFSDPLTPELVRMTPKRREGTPAELTQHPPSEMDDRSDAILMLRTDTLEFGALALGLRVLVASDGRQRVSNVREYRADDVFTFTPSRSGKHKAKASFERNGPKATEVIRIRDSWPG